ncbi:MAG: hypothetical protein GTO04_07360, partial [Planctomycetales bacterium]|nr:hypothetical protein [Planctomycetales bacterium]
IRAIYQAVRLLSHTITQEEVRVGAKPVADRKSDSPKLRQIAGGNGR